MYTFDTVVIMWFLFFSAPVILVGNKIDLHQERSISAEEGRKLAESWKATFLETSAKNNDVSFFKKKVFVLTDY